MLELTLAFDAARPVRDQGRANSAFVHIMFVEPKRRARNIRPRFTVTYPRLGRARHRRGTAVLSFGSAGTAADVLGARTVVLQVDDQRVVQLPVRAQSSDQPAD